MSLVDDSIPLNQRTYLKNIEDIWRDHLLSKRNILRGHLTKSHSNFLSKNNNFDNNTY